MRVRAAVMIPVAAWALACAGCQREGLFEVNGKVLYKGEPAAGATVYFHRTSGEGQSGDVVPMGVVQEDGRFWVTSGDDSGAPAGTYDVRIEWLDQPTSSKGGARLPVRAKGRREAARALAKPGPSRVRPPDRLKGRYFDVDHALVKADVKPGTNVLPPFELTD